MPLPQGLRYKFLGSDRTYPMIISSSLDDSQVRELLDTLRRYRMVIGYTLADIKGINPSLCMHRIHLEDESKISIEHQRRLNTMLQEVIVPKKEGMMVVTNEKNELIPTRMVTGWRMCIDYRKLNVNTREDHFPLSFIDQMLERLALHSYFCFFDGYLQTNLVLN
ncbi:PREDICTED: uncharacterized protein LOC109117187 isoform X2 [Tarenaya hassleriana]|uniref:uncharacterized protein LOC109117187 isoform X2 n=1 Tax=Tarenaya hassleriana TaxID=28532 RepID=UPI0008FD6EDE|nr:PREDICTED: uncharacterized protein LOC109117187 isoform X2 [Tarenaya hassleriana]